MEFLGQGIVIEGLKRLEQQIPSKYGVERIEIYKSELTNHSIRLGFLLEFDEVKKIVTRDYLVNELGSYALIESEVWCVRILNKKITEEGNYLTLEEAIEAAKNKQYPSIIGVWGTVDSEKVFPYVGVYDSETDARNLIGKEIIGELKIVDVIKGYCIIGPDRYAIDKTKDFYFKFDDALQDLRTVKGHNNDITKHNVKEKNAILYDEQIYLLSFWLTRNIKDFTPTYEKVKDELFIEFGITDPIVYKDVYELIIEK